MSYRYPLASSELWQPPATPSAVDDEFVGASLSAAWTRSYTVSASAIDPLAAFAGGNVREDYNGFRRSWIRWQPPGDGAQYFIHKPFTGGVALPNGLYWARMGLMYRFGSVANNDANCFMQLSATSAGVPDNSNRLTMYLNEANAGSVSPFVVIVNAGVSTTSTVPNQINTGLHWEYVAVIRSTNNFSCFVGTRQGSWMFLATLAYTAPSTINRIALGYGNAAITAPGNTIGKADFFRYSSSLDLP